MTERRLTAPPSIYGFSAGRRRLIQAVMASTGLAVAGVSFASCSNGDPEAAPNLVPLFFPSFVLVSGRPQRVPFGLIDQGIPLNESTTEFGVKIYRGDTLVYDSPIDARIVAHDHPAGDAGEEHEHADLLRYFAVRTTLNSPGIYDLELSFDGRSATLPFQVFDPADPKVIIPLPGEKLPELRFPTFDNEMGMKPICTQFNDPCPLHDKTIEQALATGKPLALLIATPAFCATAYCGPVLDVLLEQRPDFPGIEFLHAEVFLNPGGVQGELTDPDVAKSPTVEDLALPFEPTLFLVAPDRTIIDRIDNVYDNTELRQALEQLA